MQPALDGMGPHLNAMESHKENSDRVWHDLVYIF